MLDLLEELHRRVAEADERVEERFRELQASQEDEAKIWKRKVQALRECAKNGLADNQTAQRAIIDAAEQMHLAAGRKQMNLFRWSEAVLAANALNQQYNFALKASIEATNNEHKDSAPRIPFVEPSTLVTQ